VYGRCWRPALAAEYLTLTYLVATRWTSHRLFLALDCVADPGGSFLFCLAIIAYFLARGKYAAIFPLLHAECPAELMQDRYLSIMFPGRGGEIFTRVYDWRNIPVTAKDIMFLLVGLIAVCVLWMTGALPLLMQFAQYLLAGGGGR
jgi:hypothetical protein